MTTPKAAAWFFALTLLGLVGNHFRYPIFFNIDFLFGSIFSMLALQLLGSRAGIISAVLSASITFILWNHPYAIVILGVEAAVVAWLHRRKRLDLVVADALYWCVLGMPLVYLFYAEVMHLPQNNVTINMMKQAINGLTNVLLARILFMAVSYRWGRGVFSLRELVFNALLMSVLIPSLFLMASHGHEEQANTDQRLREELIDRADATRQNINRWLQEHLDQITYLARVAGKQSPANMQAAMDQTRLTDADIVRVGLMNEHAISIAYSPTQDEMGNSLLGKDYSERPYLAKLKSTLAPLLSEVVVGRIETAMPITAVIAPVVVDQQLRGFVSGVLNMTNLNNVLANSVSGAASSTGAMRYTLLDQHGRVIVSSNPHLRMMNVYAREKGETITLPDGLLQWFPETKRHVSVSSKWKDAVYISDTRVGKTSEWRLILETPVAPYQAKIFAEYSSILARLGVILLLALVFTRDFSTILTASLTKVRDATNDLPQRLASKQPIVWQPSPVQEAQEVLDNFQRMAQSLRAQFASVNELNATLEQRVTERTHDLQESQALFKAMADTSPLAIYMSSGVEQQGQYANDTFTELFGYSLAEVTDAAHWWPLAYPDEAYRAYVANEWQRKVTQAIATGSAIEPMETVVTSKDGSKKFISWGLVSTGDVNWAFGLDQTAHRHAQASLQLAANVFTHTREGIAITDATGTIVNVNDAFTRITGYSRDEVLGQNPRILKSGRQAAPYYEAMWQALKKEGHWTGEIWNRRKDGGVYAEILTISAVLDGTGKTQHYVALFTDITPIKDHQRQLEHIAHFDALTNLPNRMLLADRLQQALVQSQRRKHSLAVVFLDLDGFKAVNDTHGHAVGDELLIAVSSRMKIALREGDTLARIGGDEFVAVLADLEQAHDFEPILARMLLAASDPVNVGDIVVQVSTSMGVTLYPQDGSDAEVLMRHADQAMYSAKQAGKNRFHLFDVAQHAAVNHQRDELSHIRLAVDRQQFVLFYQPKVNMKTGEVVGAEALIRWQHPERGLLAPAAFLPLIENHPISIEVGEWVIATALAQMSSWHDQGLDLPVSVNLGAHQLQQDGFAARLASLLAARPEVRPHCLQLEVLETSALEDMAQVSAAMAAGHDIGVSFALDDFGTGYSSLVYLKHLPAETLKVDQSFVRDMLEDAGDLAIVNGVVGLARAFGREVIAEGVETLAHGQLLMSIGCDLAQGYGIARPMPAADMPGWVATWLEGANWTA